MKLPDNGLSRIMKSSQLIIGLGAILVIGIATVALVRLQLPDTFTPVATLDIEIAKAALTGCIIAVAGAVIEVLVKAREQRVQAARIQADLLSRFLQELGKHYRSVKAMRRRLRSLGLTTRYGNSPDFVLSDEQLRAYQEAISTIEESQLAFEGFEDQFKKFPLFSAIRDGAKELGTMEEYLNLIKKEHDSVMSQISSDKTRGVSFSNLPRLEEFTADASAVSTILPISDEELDTYKFKTHFSRPYHYLWTMIGLNLETLTESP